MVLNFKADRNGRLWFLWCSGLRLKAEETNLNVENKLLEDDYPDFFRNSKN